MKIDETLKENLLVDVEQSLGITLTENDKTFLARCFEITIGHHYAKVQPDEEKQGTEDKISIRTIKRILRFDIPTLYEDRHISIADKELYSLFQSQPKINVSDQEAIQKCADLLINRNGLINISVAYSMGFKDCLQWLRDKLQSKQVK
jgi:hypothetical protein